MKIKPSLLLLIAVLGFFAYKLADRIWLEDWRAQRQTPAEQAGNKKSGRGGLVPVRYSILKGESVEETLLITGTLVPNEETDLRSESSGKITAIYFREDSRVKTGDLLVKINDKDLQAQYQRAIHRQKLAQDKETRQAVLLKKEAVSQEEYETALTELNSLKAETELIKAQIERTEIRAPFDGTVGLRRVSVGDYISPTVSVADLVNTDPIKLNFSIPEKYSTAVTRHARVDFTVDGSHHVFQAQVYAIEPKIDISTRTIQLRAQTPNPGGRLVAGSFARVKLGIHALSDGLMVPAEALISEASGAKAFVFKNGEALLQAVETGTRTEHKVQITKGLKIGDTLIVSGILQLRNGSKVKLIP